MKSMPHGHPIHIHRRHNGMVIAFGSFLHGSGRSTIANRVAEVLNGSVRFSTGGIFRRISEEMGFDDISKFAEYLVTHPRVMTKVENRIDLEAYRRIRELVKEGKIVVVDSNLHAHPHALKDVPSVHFYVYASPEVIGKRLIKAKREGERSYKDPKEAFESQVLRTMKDADRYAILKKETEHRLLRHLYHHGEQVIRRLLRAYLKYKDARESDHLKASLARATGGKGILLDNNRELERSVKFVLDYLRNLGYL